MESLDLANKYLRTSFSARYFVEKYMDVIIEILVQQQPERIGPYERGCVEASLASGVDIVARDLEIQIDRSGHCRVLKTLSHLFARNSLYYRERKRTRNGESLRGLPDVRLKMIDRFRSHNGFRLLHRYVLQKMGAAVLDLDLAPLHQVLRALGDTIFDGTSLREDCNNARGKDMEEDAVLLSHAIMRYFNGLHNEALSELLGRYATSILRTSKPLFDGLIVSRRNCAHEFYRLWMALALKLIESEAPGFKMFGWDQIDDLIKSCADHRPPPRLFVVTGAGCSHVNGRYEYSGEVTDDGYAMPMMEKKYSREIPDSEGTALGGGRRRTITLFCCKKRSGQMRWFISKADEEQPGTNRDVDYYMHMSKTNHRSLPPASGWDTCRAAGIQPAPTLQAAGVLVPAGEEQNTLEHQLAKWAVENEVVERVLLGGIAARCDHALTRSITLIKFLASMCPRDDDDDDGNDVAGGRRKNNRHDEAAGNGENAGNGDVNGCYCLRLWHLDLAWKTCASNTDDDDDVTARVYKLLVSALRFCPSHLAVPFLKNIRHSLLEEEGDDETEQTVSHRLSCVGKFCSALASSTSPVDADSSTTDAPCFFSDNQVGEEIFDLFWAVLTHPHARRSIEPYDDLMRFVRERFSRQTGISTPTP